MTQSGIEADIATSIADYTEAGCRKVVVLGTDDGTAALLARTTQRLPAIIRNANLTVYMPEGLDCLHNHEIQARMNTFAHVKLYATPVPHLQTP